MNQIEEIKHINGIDIPKRFKLIKNPDDIAYILYLDDKPLHKSHTDKHKQNFFTTPFNSSQFIGSFHSVCLLSDISLLTSKDLIKHTSFNCNEKINDELTFQLLIRDNQYLIFYYIITYDMNLNQNNLLKGDIFYKQLLKMPNFKGISNKVENNKKVIQFTYKSTNSNDIIKNIHKKITKHILYNYNSMGADYNFKAIFNLPEKYQSILKPYLLYFEEFLNDLCIESDVNIQKVGEDTILSVEPKNKDEALEKIADALKAYLCAPVMAENVSVEESLQMKTAVTKLYAQCKNLESQMMYKELTLTEQNKQLEIKDNIINESKRVLVEAGVDTNIITQNNTILLESLKSIKINDEETNKKTFLSSIKAKIDIPKIFKGSLEFKKDKL